MQIQIEQILIQFVTDSDTYKNVTTFTNQSRIQYGDLSTDTTISVQFNVVQYSINMNFLHQSEMLLEHCMNTMETSIGSSISVLWKHQFSTQFLGFRSSSFHSHKRVISDTVLLKTYTRKRVSGDIVSICLYNQGIVRYSLCNYFRTLVLYSLCNNFRTLVLYSLCNSLTACATLFEL